jgi:hypothetical protein
LLRASNRQRRRWVLLADVLVGGDVDPDGLLRVDVGQRRLQQAARPEPSGCHGVDFRGVQGQLRAQTQPKQQAKDDREQPIHLAGVAQKMADQVATEGLQDLPKRYQRPAAGTGSAEGSVPGNAIRNSPTLAAAAAAKWPVPPRRPSRRSCPSQVSRLVVARPTAKATSSWTQSTERSSRSTPMPARHFRSQDRRVRVLRSSVWSDWRVAGRA